MDLQTLPRTAITSYLEAIKWPVETGLRLAGREDGPAALAVDRVDGTVRTVIGGVLRDEQLRQDGNRRLTAVEERTRAIRLRVEAELRRERADEEFAEDRERAAAVREQAEERAEEQRKRAERAKQARERRAAEAERKRKAASDAAAAKVEEAVEERAKRDRLEVLEERAEALDKQEDALTATDEAQRLAAAAGAAKEARKRA
jgi:dTMP kinase